MKIAYLAYVDSPGSGVKKIDSQIVAWNFLGHDVRPFFATSWLWSHNNERPNMGIGGITPAMKLKLMA